MKRQVREIQVITPEGEKKLFKNMVETCKEMGWSYNYISTRDAIYGFTYRDHKVQRTVRQ